VSDGAGLIPPRNGEGDHAKHGEGGLPPPVLRAPIATVKAARRDRRAGNLPEVPLLQQLRKRPGGFKFRYQFPCHPYRLDFACLSVRLAVEIDGEVHSRGDQPARDERRDRILAERGFATLRIPAREVLRDMDAVVTAIIHAFRERGPLHQPSAGSPPRSGEE
jgi:very-short-patch-repair endonuclease